MRKSLFLAGLAVVTVLAMALSALAGSSMPAAKATAKVADMTVLSLSSGSATSTGWVTVLDTALKTANQKDLFVDVSLQSGLYTQTTVRSKDMNKDTSTAGAAVKVRVLVDGQAARPGAITFNSRHQELSATLQGQVALVDKNGNGVIEEGELETVAEEEISLLLNTISANSFNFVMPNLTAGVHHVMVEAQIETNGTWQSGSAKAQAVIGAGSVTVEEVRFVQNNDIELE